MPKIPEKVRDDRREAILQAAVDCLATNGYAGTNMRTIAEAVGLTKGGLYPYFENKDAILLAVADRYLAHTVELLAPREGVSADAQLAEYMDDYKASTQDPRTAIARRAVLDLWLSAGDRPQVRASIEQRYQGYLTALTALVRRGQEEGTFRRDVTPEHVGGLILAARDGMVFQSLKLGAPVPVPELTDLMCDVLLDSLCHPGGPAESRATVPRKRARATAGASSDGD